MLLLSVLGFVLLFCLPGCRGYLLPAAFALKQGWALAFLRRLFWMGEDLRSSRGGVTSVF